MVQLSSRLHQVGLKGAKERVQGPLLRAAKGVEELRVAPLHQRRWPQGSHQGSMWPCKSPQMWRCCLQLSM